MKKTPKNYVQPIDEKKKKKEEEEVLQMLTPEEMMHDVENPEETPITEEEIQELLEARDNFIEYSEVSYIKLTNGEELLAIIPDSQFSEEHKDEPMLVISLPLKINTVYNYEQDNAMYIFTPWIPLSDQEFITISPHDVLTTTNVRESVSDLYRARVRRFLEQLAENTKFVDLKSGVFGGQEPDLNNVGISSEDPNLSEEEADRIAKEKKKWVN